jgi:hypothetical protein
MAMVAMAFSLPFGRPITTPIIIVWALFSIMEIIKGQWDRFTFADFFQKPFIFLTLPIGFYMVSILGLLYTSDRHQGFFELEKKISLLAFPLLFFFFRKRDQTNQRHAILTGYLWGIVSCCFTSISIGFYNSTKLVEGKIKFRTAVNDAVFERGDSFFEQVTQGGNYFFGDFISPFMHPSYYGMYLSFALFVAFWVAGYKRKWATLGILLLILTVLLFSDAKGPLISLCCTIIFITPFFLKSSKVSWGIFAIALAAIIVLLSLSPRTKLMVQDLHKTIAGVNYNSTESTALRIIVWRAASEVILENWMLGVGTGDGELAITDRTKLSNRLAHEIKLNAHNEYLEAFMTLGLAGFSLLCTMLVWPYIHSYNRRQWIFMAFLMIVFFNMLFESLLQTFQGVVFFSFFYSLQVVGLANQNDESIAIS